MQNERHNNILRLLDETGFVNVMDLAGRFGVTTETIRRDLEKLEGDGLLKKVRGGAVITQPRERSESPFVYESAYLQRKEEYASEKLAIAKAAAATINDGDTIIMSPGTTTLAVASMIHSKHDVTVITNSLPIAMELSDCDGVSVFCLGGFLRSENYSVIDDSVSESISMFNANKLIIGVGAISAENGLTDYRMDESSVLRAFINKADQIIGVADHSKIGKVLRVNICPISKIDCLITDAGISDFQQQSLEKAGLRVRIAE